MKIVMALAGAMVLVGLLLMLWFLVWSFATSKFGPPVFSAAMSIAAAGMTILVLVIFVKETREFLTKER